METTDGAGARTAVAAARLPTERLEAEICTRAGRLAVLECRWLQLVAEFDRRRGYESCEHRSTAHWLTWKCGMGSRTAHERVRVARRLEELPLVTAAFARGELSYSRVRAITRIAVPATEADLVAMARHATGAQIERLVAGRRRVDREARGDADDRSEHEVEQEVRWWHDETGAVVIRARLAPEAGAVVVKALEEAVRQERARDGAGEGPPSPSTGADSTGSGSRKCSAEHSPEEPARPRAAVVADALVTVADGYLADPDRARTGTDRHTVLVLVDQETLTGRDPHGSCTLDDGTAVEPDTARRLACDCSRQAIIRGADGSLLDAGHTTRTVNRATRRALHVRDGGCVFPGCDRTRWVDAHHIVHWVDHGPTRLDNLVLLCRHHHRAVHEGGYRLRGDPQQGPVRFERPDGSAVDPGPVPVAMSLDAVDHRPGERPVVGAETIGGQYAGEPLDLVYAVGCLMDAERSRGRPRGPGAVGGATSVTR